MKFTRREHIITTIFDGEVVDNKVIRTIFENLNEHRIQFSIFMRKPLEDQNFTCLSHPKVRVRKIHKDEDVIDITILGGFGTTVQKNIPFSDIISVSVLTKKHKVLDAVDDFTRFDLLDL